MEGRKFEHTLEGKKLTVELNNWAEQAHGSVLVSLGDTVVLATAVMSQKPREGGGDFFPLMVDYEEKFYAVGRILGSRFMKREARPSEEAVLAARLIDRSIRPRFDHRIRNDVQVILTILSLDEENDPDIPALFGASLALSLSDIPFNGPVAGVRVSKKDGELILNPSYEQRTETDIEIMLSGIKGRLNMIEAGAQEISEEDFAQAVEWAEPKLKELITFQESIIAKHAPKKRDVPLTEPSEALKTLIAKEFSTRIEEATYSIARDSNITKQASAALEAEVKADWMARALETEGDAFHKGAAEMLFDEEINRIIHARVIEKGERPDGRSTDQLRTLSAEVGMLPRVHGSGMFMRGETHVLSNLTLGAPGDEQIVEGMEVRTKKHFLHHYNFPPFSVGEARPMRGPGRREIGHGALAGKALTPFIPSRDEFPYTIRIVSEALSSNGSTSMASVCGSSLALMDAGVPIKKHIAGAAMGLIMNEQDEYKVLTDIQGPEDHHGDMDFKVAGTRDGITAVQLDVKIEGITTAMIRDTLTAAHTARMNILDVMEGIIKEPRPELSQWAPRVNTLKINPEKIGALIGPGGKVINEIIEKTGAQIDVEDDGTIFITSTTSGGMDEALAMVKRVTKEIKPGEMFDGKVTRILDFGAFVEIGPRQEGLVHISELAPWRVEKVTDIVNIGDEIPVKVKEIDEKGRINLSLKDVPGRYQNDENPKTKGKRPRP